MDRLISEQAVLEVINNAILLGRFYYGKERTIEEIKAIPSEEPKTGHWEIPVQDDGMSDPIYYQVRCSKCGFDLDPQTWHMELHQYSADKYCPKCGCNMSENPTS